MGRVSHAELRGDGEALDRRRQPNQPRLQTFGIEWGEFVAVGAMAAGEEHDRVAGEGIGESGAFQHGRLEADDNQSHRATAAGGAGVAGGRSITSGVLPTLGATGAGGTGVAGGGGATTSGVWRDRGLREVSL